MEFSAYYYALINSPMLLEYVGQEGMKDILSQVSKSMNFEIPALSFRYIFFNNLRAIFVSLILGVFTLSVGGMMTYLLNLGLIGGVLGLTGGLGYSPLMVLIVGVLPHGIFEIHRSSDLQRSHPPHGCDACDARSKPNHESGLYRVDCKLVQNICRFGDPFADYCCFN